MSRWRKISHTPPRTAPGLGACFSLLPEISHKAHTDEGGPGLPFAFPSPAPMPAPTAAMSENAHEFGKRIKKQLRIPCL